MRILHELEERADRHRQEALKKIEALEQEQVQEGAPEIDPEPSPEFMENI
ncbi:MAG TPA: hypothetical protein VG498_00260 [Terriglobales bacterium]|nr:hypothetical protein [Terriglobales bacterium]